MKIHLFNSCDNREIMKKIFAIVSSLLFIELSSNLFLSVEGSIGGRDGGLLHHRHQGVKSRRFHRSSDDCVAVAQSISADSSIAIPAKKFHDPDLQICNRHSSAQHVTCCSRDAERHLHSMAEKEFRHVISAHGAFLKDLLTKSTEEYLNEFLQILHSAHNRTRDTLMYVYNIPEADVQELVEELFVDLTSYLRRQKIDIDESSDRFFNSLFPLIYRIAANNGSISILTPEQRHCILNLRQTIQPFGFGPRRLAVDLTKSFGTARSLLEAFQLAADVMNATNHVTVGDSCSVAVTRLSKCPVCEGHVDVRPCADFCYNVMRGCLLSLTQLSPHWNKFVDSVEQISSSMKGSYDIQFVLQELDTRLSDLIVHAFNTFSRYESTVVSKCGALPQATKTSGGSGSPHSSRSNKHVQHDPGQTRHGPEVKLSAKIEMFVRNVAASKNFYNKLPDALCSSERLSAGNYETCWNGTHLGPYTKDVTALNYWSQIDLNPEVKIDEADQVQLLDLTDRLERMAQLLRSRILPPHLMLADEVVASGGGYSGRGVWDSYPDGTDDEDGYASGSGSGGGETTVEVPGVSIPGSDIPHSSNPGTTTDLEIDDSKAPSPHYPTKAPTGEKPHHGTSGATMTHPLVMTSFVTSLVIILCRLVVSQP